MKINQSQAAVEDAELVRRILQGETGLFAVLTRRSHERVCRALRSILRNSEEDLEDAAQQTYLLAYMHLRDFTGNAAFSTWLIRIACNEAFAILRKRGRHAPLAEAGDLEDDSLMAELVTPEDHAAARQSRRFISRAIGRLTPTYRSAFLLREVQEHSTAETASMLGITIQAVKTRIHRARLAMRQSLSKSAGEAALL